jgi:DNA-binding PadR family transcriptional regulator
MLATRLLLLGTVRIFQPVHGYFVRRELLSWHADAWANLNPGSVYNGLRSLARDGFVDEVGTETQGGRPARTTYRLTGDGESEFLQLLRDALWKVSPFEPADLMAGWSFAWALQREEVIAALEHRLEQIEASARAVGYAIEDIPNTPTTPDTVAEHYRLAQARLDGEAAWARQLLERLRAGEYWFDGEPDPPWSLRERADASPGATE